MESRPRPSRLTHSSKAASTPDRRRICRYSVVRDDVWLGWWVGSIFVTTAAKIVNLSFHGSLLRVETLPPRDLHSLWFSLPQTADTEGDWMEAKLIGMRKRLFGPREVRVTFRNVFPYEVFRSVVYGQPTAIYEPKGTWVPDDSVDRSLW